MYSGFLLLMNGLALAWASASPFEAGTVGFLVVAASLVLLGFGFFKWITGRRQRSEPSSTENMEPPPPSIPPDMLDQVAFGVIVVDSTYMVEHVNDQARVFFPEISLTEGVVLPKAFVERLPASGSHDTFLWPEEKGMAVRVDVKSIRRSTGLYRVLTLSDMTDSVQTKATLRDTDSLLRAILKTSVAAIAVVNGQGEITYANKQAESILGLNESDSDAWSYEQVGWTLTPIDETDTTTRTPLYDVLETGAPIRGMHCKVTWPDSTDKYLLLNAALLPAIRERPRQVVFSVQDITERHQAQQQLKDEKRFSEAAINSLPGIFYMVDQTGRHRRWNKTFESATGYTAEELSKRTLADLFDPGDRTRVQEVVDKMFPSGQGFSVEARLVSKDGTRTPYVFTGAALTIDDTNYLVGVGLDVTAQKRRERALRAARQEAESARVEAERMNDLKTSFLANMSHEIRTPLTTMIGYADVLVEDDNPPEQFARYIAQGGRRLLNTLDAILSFSQIETESYELTPSQIDVDTWIAGAVDPFRTRTDANVTVDVPERPIHAFLDAKAVSRIVEHLMRNAVTFTDPNDTITVQVAPTKEGVTLTVSDTGPGIPAEYVPHAFEPFTQASTGRARAHEGSGLGLAIVQGLTELMGGYVTLETTEGEGTMVTVWLPRRLEEVPASNPTEEPHHTNDT